MCHQLILNSASLSTKLSNQLNLVHIQRFGDTFFWRKQAAFSQNLSFPKIDCRVMTDRLDPFFRHVISRNECKQSLQIGSKPMKSNSAVKILPATLWHRRKWLSFVDYHDRQLHAYYLTHRNIKWHTVLPFSLLKITINNTWIGLTEFIQTLHDC